MDKTKLFRIAENLASDLYSYQDGETDVNNVYKVLELALYNVHTLCGDCSDNDRLWNFFWMICHSHNVYLAVLNQYKEDLLAMIIK